MHKNVEKMWKGLGESLWRKCGKVSTWWRNEWNFGLACGLNGVFHRNCGKFYGGFAHGFNRGSGEDLHSFHIVYYYNY